MKKFLKNNGLSLVTLGLFVVFLIGQSITGMITFNSDQSLHGKEGVSFLHYLLSGTFVESVFENWESEFLQMGLYVFLTANLFQKGSAESKSLTGKNEVDEIPEESRMNPKAPWPVKKGGWILAIYERSLTIALLLLFAVSFFLHAAGGAAHYRKELAGVGRVEAMSIWNYMMTSRFWFESFQNWQSEFLSIGVLVILSIYLRQKGSPESKPVAMPHDVEP